MRRVAFLSAALVALSVPRLAVADEAARPPASASPPAEAPPTPAEPPPSPSPPSEVLVVGSRETHTAGSGLILKTKQLERFEHDDPTKVLTAAPGVYVRQEDGVGLRPNVGMRGAAPDRSKKITLMEDGVLFAPAPYSAPAAYYFPLITRMTSVKVLKGPSAILYGPHTVGGAIDLVTAPIPDTGRGSVDLAAGMYGYQKVHFRAGTSDETWGVLLEGVHLSSTGFKTIDVVGGNTGFSRNEWMGKVRRALPSHGGVVQEVELKVGYSSEDSHETYLGLSDADFRRDPLRRYAATQNDEMLWTRTAWALTHRARMGTAVELVTTAYRNDFSRSWNRVQGLRLGDLYSILKSPQSNFDELVIAELRGTRRTLGGSDTLLIGPNQRTFVAYGVQSALHLTAKTGPFSHSVEQGVRFHHDSIARLHTQRGFVLDGGAVLWDRGPTETTADNRAASDALSMWVMDAISFSRFTLTAGARIESVLGRYSDHLTGTEVGISQRLFLPGAGLYAALTRDLGVFGGVHEGATPAPPTDQTSARPERSTNYEAGLRYAPRRFRAEVIGFYNAYSNLTSVCSFSSGCTSDGVDRQYDAGKATIRGVEVYVESELRAGRGWTIPGRFAYTFTDARFLSSFSSDDPTFGHVAAGDRLPYVPRQQVTAALGAEHRRGGMHLGLSYVGRMREVAGQGVTDPTVVTDALLILDASATYKVSKGLSVYVNGRNLTNQHALVSRRPFGARPNAPIWVQSGVKAEF